MEMAIHGMDFEIDGMFRTNEGLDFFEKWAQNGAFWRPFEEPLDVRRTKSRVYKNRPYLSVAATVKMGGAVRVKKIRLCQLTMDNGWLFNGQLIIDNGQWGLFNGQLIIDN